MHRILAILLATVAINAAEAVVLESKTSLTCHSMWGNDTYIAIVVDKATGTRIMLIRCKEDAGGVTAVILPPEPVLPAEAPIQKGTK